MHCGLLDYLVLRYAVQCTSTTIMQCSILCSKWNLMISNIYIQLNKIIFQANNWRFYGSKEGEMGIAF